MRATRWIGGLLLLAAAGCGEALEPTEMVPLDQVPEAAMKTAQEKLPDVKFDTAWKEHEQEDGEEVFEVRGKTANGKTRDIKVTAGGKVLEVD